MAENHDKMMNARTMQRMTWRHRHIGRSRT